MMRYGMLKLEQRDFSEEVFFFDIIFLFSYVCILQSNIYDYFYTKTNRL